MNKQQLLIIHGGMTFNNEGEYLHFLKTVPLEIDRLRSKKDWKETLQEQLGENFDVLQPRMPNGTNAQYKEWKLWFERVGDLLDDTVILVGHSLGGIFLAKYLSENNFSKKIKSLHLLAAPFDNTDMEESLGSFEIIHSLESISAQVKNIYLYHSKDDKVVPFVHSKLYIDRLPGATLRVFENRGHLKQDDFPELVEDIRDIK